MKKILFLLLIPICFAIFFLAPKGVQAADPMGGVWVHVKTNTGTDIPNVAISMEGYGGSYYYAGLGTLPCSTGAIVYDGPAGGDGRQATPWVGYTAGNGWTGFSGIFPLSNTWGYGASCQCGVATSILVPNGYYGQGERHYSNLIPYNNGSKIVEWVLTPLPPPPPPQKGYHDAVNGEIQNDDWTTAFISWDTTLRDNGYSTTADNSCNITLGWACDPNNWGYQSSIHLYDGSQTAVNWSKPISNNNSISANVARNANYGFGGACGGTLSHAFVYKIPASLKDGTDHYIWAYAFTQGGSNYPLGGTPRRINCPAPPPLSQNTCPTLTASPTSVKQGDPVKLSWSGGLNVKNININQKPSGGTLATINSVTPGGGSLEVVPSKTTSYWLFVTYNDNTTKDCPSQEGVMVTVRPNQSGSDRPVPPN